MWKILVCFAVILQFSQAYNRNEILASPSYEKCRNRPRGFNIDRRNYFFSENFTETKGKEVTWLGARNICREQCMDSISIETQREFEIVKELLEDFLVSYIWTSGLICDYRDCVKKNQLDPAVNGWTWMHNNVQVQPTDRISPGWTLNPWSETGYRKVRKKNYVLFLENINRLAAKISLT